MFAKLVRWWLVLKPWERSGRMYAWLGVPALDRGLSRLFGELPLPEYAPGRTLSRAALMRKLARGQYNEVVNVMCAGIFIVAGLLGFASGHPALGIWGFVLSLQHVLIVPIERYKRAVGQVWRAHPEALLDHEQIPETSAPPRTVAELNRGIYPPLPFESEKFYEAIGVMSFRHYVFWMTHLAEQVADDEMRAHMPNSLKGGGMDEVEQFERGTRQSELVHWLGVPQHVPFLLVWVGERFWPGIALVTWIFYLNFYAIFLQRQHRCRVLPLLRRRALKRERATQP